MTLLFAGDTHGPLDHFSDVPADATVIHVGDFAPLNQPLEDALPRHLHDRFWWIPGNHDYDSAEDYAAVFTAFGRARCFDLSVIEVDGVRIAGMGGIFSGKTWWPKTAIVPGLTTRDQRLRATPKAQRINDGLSLRQRKYIFREDFDRLSQTRAHILVTHEAPTTHEHGFMAINELGRLMGVHTIVHGHHHRDYVAKTNNGITVIGVGLRGLADLQGTFVRPGQTSHRRVGASA